MATDYLNPSRYPAGWQEKFAQIRECIGTALMEYPNFGGVTFTDVSAGGIQVQGWNTKIPAYAFVSITMDYSLVDAAQVVGEFIDVWKESDIPSHVAAFQGYVQEGNQYGWD